jgi:hypothetical protein
VALHVALVADELRAVGHLDTALIALGTLGVAALVAFVTLLFAERATTFALTGWGCAVLDAVALVAIARLTVAIDPTASIAWAFALWAPFAVAVRATPIRATIASVVMGGLVYGACRWTPSGTASLEQSWTAYGVPMLLVSFGGITAAVALLHHHRFRASRTAARAFARPTTSRTPSSPPSPTSCERRSPRSWASR